MRNRHCKRNRNSRFAGFARLAVIAIAFGAGWPMQAGGAEDRAGQAGGASAGEAKEADDAKEARERVYATIVPADEKGFQRMGPPKEGEWLTFYKEKPQSLERYRFAANIRPDEKRRTIVLQPIGILDDERLKALEIMRQYAETFFQLPARVAKPIADIQALAPAGVTLTRVVPLGNRHGTYDKQYNADKILSQILVKQIPEDAIAYLGITMEDLWSGEMNFVFGLGHLDKRVGIYSLCRYYPEFWGRRRTPGGGDEVLALKRGCKVLNHEAGHMFGLTHCVFYNCSMNGSNSLQETDRAPIHYCPVCHRKLQWNFGFDAAKRYEALRAFYETHKMSEEAQWMAERIKQWKTVEEMEKARKLRDE